MDGATFAEAQQILAGRTINKSDEELLDSLRLSSPEKAGCLSGWLRIHRVPSPSTYRLRFGSLRHAYRLIGYGRPEQFGRLICVVERKLYGRNLSQRSPACSRMTYRSFAGRKMAQPIAAAERANRLGANSSIDKGLEKDRQMAN